MKERPIIFSAPMVRAILAGRKTQTRRAIKPQPPEYGTPSYGAHNDWRCPFGVDGDRLFVREALGVTAQGDCEYLADGQEIADARASALCRHYGDSYLGDIKTVSPIFMPRWASRITLEVTKVRVERLQDIGEADAIAEGAQISDEWTGAAEDLNGSHVMAYRFVWDSINVKRAPWASNPWVWAVEFIRINS